MEHKDSIHALTYSTNPYIALDGRNFCIYPMLYTLPMLKDTMDGFNPSYTELLSRDRKSFRIHMHIYFCIL